MKKIFKNIFKITFVILVILLFIYIINVLINRNIYITKYKISSNKIPIEFDGYKIVQLTDVHSIRNENQKQELIKKIKTLNSELVCITGDLIDSPYYSEEDKKYKAGKIDLPDKLTIEFMEELLDIADVYFVYGNHEMMLLDDPENNVFKTSLENMGVKILNNKIDYINIGDKKIQITGIQDPATLYKDKKYAYVGENNQDKVRQIINDLRLNKKDNSEINNNNNNETNNEELYNIVLSHRPEYFEMYSEYDIDLLLSGHTHGGVVVLPFIGGIYAHPQGWFPKYTSGIYEKDNFKMIIGRGIGYSGIKVRIFNPPEINEIILDFTEK